MTTDQPVMTCRGCGSPADPEGPQPEHCGSCPPWICEDCGEMCSATDLCSCWIRLDQMAPADIKALFAEDGTFNVGPNGQLTVAEPLEGDDR